MRSKRRSVTAALPDSSRGSADRFGFEWATYSEVLPESKGQLGRWLGSHGLDAFKGRRVLDVGCGMGRNPYWMAMAGAREIVGIDADERCVAVSRRNLRAFPNVVVEKKSVYELDPHALGTFDRVTCIGVLMFLEDPRGAIEKMWDCVAPGGELVLWVYGRRGNRMMLPVIRAFRAGAALLPLTAVRRLAAGLSWLVRPALILPALLTEHYRFLRGLSRRNLESIVFDQLIPRRVAFWECDELKALVAGIGGAPIIEQVQGNSWLVRLVKPARAQ